MRRRAEVRGLSCSVAAVGALLPKNYEVVGSHMSELDGFHVIVEGEDRMGWTMEDYVIPRLASGNLFAKEVPVA